MTDIAEYRGKSPDELKEEALKLKKELFNLRFQAAAGEASGAGRYRSVRRDIARIKTVLNEPQGLAAPVKKEKKAKPAKAAEAKSSAEAKETKAKKTTKKKAGE